MKNRSPSTGENGQLVQSQGLVHSIAQNINLSNFSYPFDFFLQDQGIPYKMQFLKSNPTRTHLLIIAKRQPQRGHSMFLGAWAQAQQPKCQAHNKVIRKVRQSRHRNPVFGHIGEEISKNRNKQYTDLQRGMKLRPGLHECPGPI